MLMSVCFHVYLCLCMHDCAVHVYVHACVYMCMVVHVCVYICGLEKRGVLLPRIVVRDHPPCSLAGNAGFGVWELEGPGLRSWLSHLAMCGLGQN